MALDFCTVIYGLRLMAESLYTNGKATQLEVLDAQLALEAARTNMAVALFEAALADIALKKSLGLLDAGE